MFGVFLFVVAVLYLTGAIGKESMQKKFEYRLKDSDDVNYRHDYFNLSHEEFEKNIENGKYIMKRWWAEPKRNENFRVIIQDWELFKRDEKRYRFTSESWKIDEWKEMGKYNFYDDPYVGYHEDTMLFKDDAFEIIREFFNKGLIDITHEDLSRIREDRMVSNEVLEELCFKTGLKLEDILEERSLKEKIERDRATQEGNAIDKK